MNKLQENILNLYNEYKKPIIFISIFLFLFFSIFIVSKVLENNNEKDVISVTESKIEKLILFGDLKITIQQGDKYIEPGYYAITNLGEIKTDKVKVTNSVDTNKVGTYIINYTIEDKKATRIINVVKKDIGDLTLTLIGNSLMVLEQGTAYVEPGYQAYDTIDGDITQNVVVTGKINTNVTGTYTLTYTISNSSGNKKVIERKVVVNESQLEVILTKNIQTYTNNDIYINIEVTGSNFTYVKYPDGTVTKDKLSSYRITKNGTYRFYIYDNNLNYIIKEISITNIDKQSPTGKCEALIKDGKTHINVVVNDDLSGIEKYEYYGNNILLNTKNISSYVVNSKVSNPYVIVYDKASNNKVISCQVESQHNLEVHFINVGREDAILIRDDEKTIMIDGGSYSKKSIVTPYIKNLGITHIDVMIGSHLHYNHIQAQADILENFTVDKIYYPQDLTSCYSAYCDLDDQKYILNTIKKYNKKISIMKVSDSIQIGDMNIYCVGPVQFQTKSQNEYRQNYNSLNFILTYGQTKFMFTGDYMQSSNILKTFNKSLLNVDVLKYPHHGNASISKNLIDAMSPKYVILTNSRDELTGRNEKTYLSNLGASFYYSYKHKNILIQSDGDSLTIKTNIQASDYKR